MTPKEKAIELVKTYRELWIKSNPPPGITSLHLLTPANLSYIPFCKQCALIAVDEIIEYCFDKKYFNKNSLSHHKLLEVKQEIEKL